VFRVRLFGIGQASYNDRFLAGFPSQQHYRLLCYLLLNRRHAHTREQLSAVFWGEYPTATSRTYLRHTLWRLRSGLEQAGVCPDEYLTSENDTISFVKSSQHWLDVDAFESAVAVCSNAPDARLTPEQALYLE
jgi:DNA-binding SARP family transcriptional activator